jgi:hypothetical protein
MREDCVATLDTDEAVVVRDLKSGRKGRNRRHAALTSSSRSPPTSARSA